MRTFIRAAAIPLLILGFIIFALTAGCSKAPTRPLSAVAVVECGEIAAIVVQVDARTILRFTADTTDFITIDHDQKTIKHSPPIPPRESLKVAQQAIVQSTLYLCDKSDDNQT